MTFFYKKMTPSKFMPRWWYPKNIVPDIYMGLNFGEVLIHWDKNSLDVNILDQGGKVVVSKEVLFSSLKASEGVTGPKPTYEECFRERSMSDVQKRWTFQQSGIFHHVPVDYSFGRRPLVVVQTGRKNNLLQLEYRSRP